MQGFGHLLVCLSEPKHGGGTCPCARSGSEYIADAGPGEAQELGWPARVVWLGGRPADKQRTHDRRPASESLWILNHVFGFAPSTNLGRQPVNVQLFIVFRVWMILVEFSLSISFTPGCSKPDTQLKILPYGTETPNSATNPFIGKKIKIWAT